MTERIRRIDTHQHIIPPNYARWLKDKGLLSGGLPIPEWSEELAIANLDRLGLTSAILSVSTPGTYFGDIGETRERTREVNEYCADLSKRHPDKFGFFATLTLPDLEGSLAEVAYAFDKLGAKGVILLTNMEGVYVGDPRWQALLDELGRREAVVFIHPNEPPFDPVPGVIAAAADFMLETTRTAISICRSGSLDRWPGLKVILPHGGGFVPYVSERMARVCGDGTQEQGLSRLRQFYFDTALAGTRYALPSLLAFAQPDRILFGTDWPHSLHDRSLYFVQQFEQYEMPDELRTGIYSRNAEKLFA